MLCEMTVGEFNGLLYLVERDRLVLQVLSTATTTDPNPALSEAFSCGYVAALKAIHEVLHELTRFDFPDELSSDDLVTSVTRLMLRVEEEERAVMHLMNEALE